MAIERQNEVPQTPEVRRTKKTAFFDAVNAMKRRVGDPIAECNERGNDLPGDLPVRLRVAVSSALDKITTNLSKIKRRKHDRPKRFSLAVREALDECHPVVAYTLFDAIGDHESRAAVTEAARKKYILHYETYEDVLGDLVAESLRTLVDDRVRELKYGRGGNPTAAEDWWVYKYRLDKQVPGIPTPLPSVNKYLRGGISDITVVAGGEMSGKTSFCLQTLVHALRSDPQLGSLVFSLDQTKDRTLGRLYQVATGKSHRSGMTEEAQEVIGTNSASHEEDNFRHDVLARMRIVEKTNLYDKPFITSKTFVKEHQELVRNTGVSRVLLLVDMFQSLSELCDGGTSNEADEQCLSALQGYIGWSRTNECPKGATILLISEVRKDRREWGNDNLKGSSRLRSTPTNIMHLEELPGAPTKGRVVGRKLTIGKSRDGDAGEVVALNFLHREGRFEERKQASLLQPKRSRSPVRKPSSSGKNRR